LQARTTEISKVISGSLFANDSYSAVERTALSVLAEIFQSLSIRWALMGALAANRYRASPRLTQDVDVLLAGIGPSGALELALRKA
jgi:hypothetical protein